MVPKIPRDEIAGPQGIQAGFDWQAAKATSPARMCTVSFSNRKGRRGARGSALAAQGLSP